MGEDRTRDRLDVVRQDEAAAGEQRGRLRRPV
jgi:hypothetical protein